MVCMIADYQQGGIDHHCEYIAQGTNDREQAVLFLVDALERDGAAVNCITVIPGDYTLGELREIAEGPLVPGMVLFSYPWGCSRGR